MMFRTFMDIIEDYRKKRSYTSATNFVRLVIFDRKSNRSPLSLLKFRPNPNLFLVQKDAILNVNSATFFKNYTNCPLFDGLHLCQNAQKKMSNHKKQNNESEN
jgi:hypothetical protein